MSRPEVSVVVPFAGPAWQVALVVEALGALDKRPDDELILVDNSGTVVGHDLDQVITVAAPGEASPAHARNIGAERASRDWILFLDADCRPVGALLDSYFGRHVADDVGALVGEIIPAPDSSSLVARYGAARNFLSQRTHLEHPYLARAVAANLLVRRVAFDQVGGFQEGVRAAEDTDFTWRLQRAGWRLEPRSEAQVEHHYRASLGDLRRQWRGYAAGRAWLARRYDGFDPEPAVVRAYSRVRRRLSGARRRPRVAVGAPPDARTIERAGFLALDALLGVEELAGFVLSNRPGIDPPAGSRVSADLVLVADRFPRTEDPLVELATTLEHARVEATGRPEIPDREAGRRLTISYLEDEGVAARARAAVGLLARHPVRATMDLLTAPPDEPSMWALAPAVRRLEREPRARLHALGGEGAQRMARRMARLAGRPLEG